MARTLNGWTLPINTDWIDQFQHSPARQAKKRTTGGGLAVAGQVLSGGRIITLEWAQGRQWLLYADLQQLQALIDSGPLAQFPFVWDSFNATVQIDFERGAGQFTPKGKRLSPSDDKHFGQLFLFTR